MNQKGQSTVEYVLLLVVITSLAFSVYNSQLFKNFFGENAALFDVLARKIEYAYRHGREDVDDTIDYNGVHDTFEHGEEKKSRFFTGTIPYP